MIEVAVKPRADAKFDIYATEGQNGDSLVNSSQGYENRDEAVDIARRLFGNAGGLTLTAIRQVIDAMDDSPAYDRLIAIRRILDAAAERPEPVDLIVYSADGTGRHEMIR